LTGLTGLKWIQEPEAKASDVLIQIPFILSKELSRLCEDFLKVDRPLRRAMRNPLDFADIISPSSKGLLDPP
jgi:hypothetical protein